MVANFYVIVLPPDLQSAVFKAFFLLHVVRGQCEPYLKLIRGSRVKVLESVRLYQIFTGKSMEGLIAPDLRMQPESHALENHMCRLGATTPRLKQWFNY